MSTSRAFGVLVICVCMYLAFLQGGIAGCIGIGAVGFVVFDFLTQDKSWLPIGELALLLGGLQWVISPFFAYSLSDSVYKMSQPCDEYMAYTVPMYIAFMLGIYLFRKPLSLSGSELTSICINSKKISNVLIGIGLFFMFAPIHGAELSFLKTLGSYLFFIGFIVRMYMKPEKSTLYVLLALGVHFLRSILEGMFHDLLIWGVFMLMTWMNINKIEVKRRILIFVLSFIGVFLLQTAKSSYRQVIWYKDYSGSKMELFFTIMVNNAININEVQSETEETTIARYNQGWIISRIYDNIPQKHDYLGGRTYVDAFNSALLPRFLAPNKKGSGAQSRADFIEMTGYHLARGTSMGLSILGESYGNFGLFGGVIFMFFWGWLITKFISFIDRLSTKNYLWILFLPVICFNLIKAEISMMTVLNWSVKSIIFAGIIIYLLRYFRIQAQEKVEEFDDNHFQLQ